jgi:hypothetical protein
MFSCLISAKVFFLNRYVVDNESYSFIKKKKERIKLTFY